jgi:hypothetical protein
MAAKTVVDAVRARLDAEWDMTPVVWMNEGGDAEGVEFIVPQFPLGGEASRRFISNREYLEEGGIRFVIQTERGSGMGRALDIAEALGALFRDVTFDGVRTDAPSSPFFDDSNDVGNYLQSTIVVPYTFTYAG